MWALTGVLVCPSSWRFAGTFVSGAQVVVKRVERSVICKFKFVDQELIRLFFSCRHIVLKLGMFTLVIYT